jgi:hypothetical protein
MTCSFHKLEVRKEQPATPEEREARIAALAAEANDSDAGEVCTKMAALVSAIRSGKPPEGMDREVFVREFTGKSNIEMKDELENFDAFSKACAKPTRENYAHMVELEEARKARTCRLSITDFQQTFTLGSTANVWTATTAPSGLCGEMTVNVLERDAKPGIASFWRFKTRNLVTNETGAMTFRVLKELRCRDIEEGEDVYEWTAASIYRGCEYIKFSP